MRAWNSGRGTDASAGRRQWSSCSQWTSGEQLFTVDFRAELDMRTAAGSDNLEDTVDYGRIYDIAAEVMNGPHAHLLEHLAGKIVKGIAAEFPRLQSFSVRVSKRRPPVNGVAAWSRVTVQYPGDLASE